MNTLVLDLYHLNPVLDFSAVINSGIVGVIHKAYEAGVTDSLYAVRRKAFGDAGLKCWGAYAFFHGSDHGGNPTTEADNFLSAAEPDADTLIALDWETDEDGYVPSLADAKAFLSQIQYRLGRKAIVYSGNVAKEKILGQDAYMGSHRLWLAQYNTTWNVQKSWLAPWLWQNSETSIVPGIGGLCDGNVIVEGMTVDDLTSQWAV